MNSDASTGILGNERGEDWNGVDQMPSLCMACGENGMTRMMMVNIPYFRELLIASFDCDECGEHNNEVTFGGEIQLQGSVCSLNVTSESDLDRQLIKSDSATVTIPMLEFEIPAKTQKGEISTIEGILRTAAKNLAAFQEQRMVDSPEVGAKVAEIIVSLTKMAMGEILPFEIKVDDPAGNSFLENKMAPKKDPEMSTHFYDRTEHQCLLLGLEPEKPVYQGDDNNYSSLMTGQFGGEKPDEAGAAAAASGSTTAHKDMVVELSEKTTVRLGRSEAVSIPGECPNCQAEGELLTAMTDIPHFKEVIIMAFNCQSCGYRNNEVKGGGSVPTYGTEVTLKANSVSDLKRDILKSDTCMVSIPELDLEMQYGTLGGMYTTVEGLINKVHRSLADTSFSTGDSTVLHHSNDPAMATTKGNFTTFLDKVLDCANGKTFPFTLTLRDPLGNSFISAPLGSFLPPEADKQLDINDFTRNFEENEDLGLNDINTEEFEKIQNADGSLSTSVPFENETVLPDRLTHVHEKGMDHPTPYAKGSHVDDNTPMGLAATTTSIAPSTATGSTAGSTWVAAKIEHQGRFVETAASASEEVSFIDEHYGKRIFNDDSTLKFLPYEEFSGKKEGMVYRLGSQGLGYYEDRVNGNGDKATV